MKLNQREKVLVLLLPGVAICVVYFWFFFAGRHNAWKAAHLAMADALSKEPGLQDKVLLTQARLALANRARSP